MATPMPADELERLQALESLHLADVPADPVYQGIVQTAAELLDVPIMVISIVERDRLWFKASHGLEGMRSAPRDLAFCAHAILGRETLVVTDATRDGRFAANPLVTASPGVRFYAGCPLVTHSGHAIGTLCALDRVPRTLTSAQLVRLEALAQVVAELVESHAQRRQLEEARAAISLREAQLRAITDSVSVSLAYLTTDGRFRFVNATFEHWWKVRADEVFGRGPELVLESDDLSQARRALARALAGEPASFVARRPGAGEHHVEVHFSPDIGPGGIRGVFAHGIDISTRLQAEEAQRIGQLRAFNARLRAQVEGEHLRIARALHDELGQELTALRLRLDAVGQAGGDREPMAPLLQAARDALDRAFRSTHELVVDMRPPLLDALGLEQALRSLAARIGEQAGIAVDVAASGLLERLPVAQSTALYRIAQEFLTNAQKHAGAHEVRIVLAASPSEVRMELRDDGRGFDPAAVSPDRSGLLGMRERVAELGGQFTLDSTPGRGVHIEVRLPRGLQ